MCISLNVHPWTVICKWKFRKLKPFYKCYKVGIEHAPRKWFGHRVNHSCFLVFHILRLSQKWPAGCGICTLEGNWAECGRKRLENRAPHSSVLTLALATSTTSPRWQCASQTHSSPGMIDGSNLETKELGPQSAPGSATGCVILDKTQFIPGFPLEMSFLCYRILLFIIMLGQGQVTTFLCH